ncbi:hypothetical protein QBC37DRAFT_404335 [Rhypophila decipiens]|uniref:Uncharacterized protein n=1 Tax=Rhypophila decipiens TaxID=261697 RepID=A0AAN6XYT5_9PEZI|nr:hypothetical protein QBC37DRAFT_404335 [Rhypophila decipiens]
MSAPESTVAAMAQEVLFPGVVRDSYTPASPARHPSPFIQDCASPLSEQDSDDEDCLVEIEAEQFYKAKPGLHRGGASYNNSSPSVPNSNENAKLAAAEACYPAVAKAETVRNEPGSSVRITTRAPGGGSKVPPNVEVITIESGDEEDDEEAQFDDHDDYYEPGDEYYVPVDHELFDDQHFQVESQQFDEELDEDEHLDDEHFKFEDEEVEDEEIDLVDDSSENTDEKSDPAGPVTSSPAAEANQAITQSMLAMPDSPFKKTVGNQAGPAIVSPSKIAQDLYYMPDSPAKNARPEYLKEPTNDTRNWELVLDPATGGVTDYTSTEAERDEIIRLYAQHKGDMSLLRASLPGSNQTTRADCMETQRITRILHESHESGLLELPQLILERQENREDRRRRKRSLSEYATDGDKDYRLDDDSNHGKEGNDDTIHGTAPDAIPVDYDSNDSFDARFARNLARMDDAPDLKRRRGDDFIRRRAKRSCSVEASLGTAERVMEEEEVSVFVDAQ